VIRQAFLGAVLLGATACSAGEPNLLGGRHKCWSDADPRNAALLEGNLQLGYASSKLATPDGTDFNVEFPFMTVRQGLSDDATVLMDGGQVVATQGEYVTVFGGYGSDGIVLVCSIEERGPFRT
jgi:hypothetical protein